MTPREMHSLAADLSEAKDRQDVGDAAAPLKSVEGGRVTMSGNRPEPTRVAFIQGPSGELIELHQAAATSISPAEPAAQGGSSA